MKNLRRYSLSQDLALTKPLECLSIAKAIANVGGVRPDKRFDNCEGDMPTLSANLALRVRVSVKNILSFSICYRYSIFTATQE